MTFLDPTSEAARRRVRRLAACGAAVILALAAAFPPSAGAGAKPPDVVVILVDTLRPDHLGFEGHPKEMAPFLAKLATSGVVFERAFSTSSWTAPSTASLFTSLYPPQHGVVEGFRVHIGRAKRLHNKGREVAELNRLPSDVRTLPEAFEAMGYTTFGLASNVNVGSEIGFDRGFDHFLRDAKAPASTLHARVSEWKDEIRRSRPFFLYVHLNDVHEPYEEKAPYYEKQSGELNDRRARYLSEISYTDEHIRKIWETLELGDDTIVAVVSDHGEEFRDHGGLGHRSKLYIELNRVLMLIRAPALGLRPRRITANVSLIDVLPTLVELAGGTPPASARGTSLAPLLRASGEERRALAESLSARTLFAHRRGQGEVRPYWAAIRGPWKLIETPRSRLELYDHRSDPGEKRNLHLHTTNLVGPPAEMLEELRTFQDAVPERKPEAIRVEIDEDLHETLRALGYVE